MIAAIEGAALGEGPGVGAGLPGVKLGSCAEKQYVQEFDRTLIQLCVVGDLTTGQVKDTSSMLTEEQLQIQAMVRRLGMVFKTLLVL